MRTDFLLSHPAGDRPPAEKGAKRGKRGAGGEGAGGEAAGAGAGGEGAGAGEGVEGSADRCTVLEVKTVVDTDYDPALPRPESGGKVP